MKKQPGYYDDVFNKVFQTKQKKMHKNRPNQEEFDLISEFQKLRVDTDFDYIPEKQEKEKAIIPDMKNVLEVSPVPNELLDQEQDIRFTDMFNTQEINPAIIEDVAQEINKQYKFNETDIDPSNQTVVGVYDDQLPGYMLPPKNNETDIDAFRNPEVLVNLGTIPSRNYVLTSSDDEPSEPDINSENEGAYPSDNSDRDNDNINYSDEDDY